MRDIIIRFISVIKYKVKATVVLNAHKIKHLLLLLLLYIIKRRNIQAVFGFISGFANFRLERVAARPRCKKSHPFSKSVRTRPRKFGLNHTRKRTRCINTQLAKDSNYPVITISRVIDRSERCAGLGTAGAAHRRARGFEAGECNDACVCVYVQDVA